MKLTQSPVLPSQSDSIQQMGVGVRRAEPRCPFSAEAEGKLELKRVRTAGEEQGVGRGKLERLSVRRGEGSRVCASGWGGEGQE